jgi:hypothetical protein
MNPFLQKLLSGASNVASRAGQGLMPAPAGGLFSDEDIAAARKQGLLHLGTSLLGDTSGMGLGPALAGGIQNAQQAYGQDLQGKSVQNEVVKQKQLLDARKQIMQQYAPGPTDNAQTMMQKFPLMYADLMRAGDMEGAKNVQGIVERMAEAAKSGNKLMPINLGDRTVLLNQETGKMTDAAGNPVTDTTHHQTADEIADHAANRREQEARMALMKVQQDMANGQKAQAAFANQNKDLRATEQLYGNWKGAYESAKSADPSVRQAAYKSAIVNFSRIADPGQRSSLGMLHYLEQVQPSLVSRFHVTAEKLTSGDFPPEVLDAMNKHVDELHKNHISLYEARRAGRVKAQPEFDQYLDKTEDIFPSSKTIGQEQPAGSRVNKFFEGWGH